jgi:hypothetical protein
MRHTVRNNDVATRVNNHAARIVKIIWRASESADAAARECRYHRVAARCGQAREKSPNGAQPRETRGKEWVH